MRASWIVKGFANHNRIKILLALQRQSELSVGELADEIKTNEKNASQHLSKMSIAGLVIKRRGGTEVRHKLTRRGEAALKFLKGL